jgi:hypothetical protein
MQRQRRRIIVVQKTKGEGSRCLDGVVLGARRGASIAPFIGGIPPLPRSLARAKDCGVVICSSKSTTHRPGEESVPWSLCCLARRCCGGTVPVSTSFHCSHVTRRHVGQWLPPSSCSLMPDGCTRPVYQSIPRVSSSQITRHD